MKRIFLVLMVTLFTAGMSIAQGVPESARKVDPKVRAEQRAERMTKRMSKEYALNEKQQKELKEANLALVEKMGTMPFRHRGMRSEMKKHHKKCCCECDRRHTRHMRHQDMANRGKGAKHLTKAERAAWKEKMEKRRAEIRVARDAYQSKLQQIMTKEQYKAYSSKKEGKRVRIQAKG